MIRFQRTSVTVALSLVISTATAYAECAWVLWEHRVTSSKSGPPEETWSAQEAVETRVNCETRTETLIQRLVQPRASGSLYNYERIDNSKGVTTYLGPKELGTYQTSDFRCLPDTVDPREPKVK